MWVAIPLESSTLSNYYEQDYYASDTKRGYQNYVGDEENHRQNARRLVRWVNSTRDLNGARLLDFGCGFGFLLDEARKAFNCECYGVELSRIAGEYARSKLRIDVTFDSSLSNLPSDFFDVAFLIGTIEHLANPRQVLKDIARVMKLNGYLIITTVDTNGLLPFYSLKPPEHLFYFNYTNLKQLLGQTGFNLMERRIYFVNYNAHDLLWRLGKFLSLNQLCSASKAVERLVPNLSLRIPTNEIKVISQRRS